MCPCARVPVKARWSRAQKFRLGFHWPPSSHRIRARLHHSRLQTWWHAFGSSQIPFTATAVTACLQRTTNVIGGDSVARGATLPYSALERRTEFDLVRLPVRTGPWRVLGARPNVLALEVAMNECAPMAEAHRRSSAKITLPASACAKCCAAWPRRPAGRDRCHWRRKIEGS